jgi:hypothetical protein
LAAALVVTGVAATHYRSSNPSTLANGLNAVDVESAALYCTGLSGASGGVEGHVVFLNTSSATRTVVVNIVSDRHRTNTVTLHLAEHSSQSVSPASLASGNSYAVAAEVIGGGVVGEEVTSGGAAEAPCTSAGITSWYSAGFDTLVGSSAALSIYNPTATPAVLDVTTFSSNGFGAPAAFRGLSLAAHTQIELNLGTPIVNTSNIGVHVSVLRGSLVVAGVQRSGTVASLVPGSTSPSSDSWFPRVTTVENAVAELRVANPGAQTVSVTAKLELAPYTVAPLTLRVAPYSSGKIVISPNPAVPDHGYATVQLTSSGPLVSSLVTGTSGGIAISSPGTPGDEFLISDFAGRGYDAATVTNTSSQPLSVDFRVVGTNGATGSARLEGGATESILGIFSGVTTLSGKTVFITSSRPDLLVTTSLPSNPQGVTVVAPLNGR